MSSGVSFLKYGDYDQGLTCMMILKEKGGSTNFAHIGGRKKKCWIVERKLEYVGLGSKAK